MVDEGLSGRPVLVFGASGALGHGVAEAFAAAGASVTGVDKFEPPVDRRLPGVSYRAADVMDDAEVSAVFAAADGPWAVINTIGGFAPHRPLAELDPAELT